MGLAHPRPHRDPLLQLGGRVPARRFVLLAAGAQGHEPGEPVEAQGARGTAGRVRAGPGREAAHTREGDSVAARRSPTR